MAARSSASQAVPVSPYSFESVVSFINNNFALLLLAGLMFIGGFFTGSLWTENELLKSGGAKVAAAPAAPQVAGDTGAVAPPPVDKMPAVTDEDHIKGNKNAKVILVEYSDFECPFCARFHPTLEQVKEEFGNDVAWVYRHYPLSFHPNAQKAAEGSECAADQKGDDGFWAFGDSLIAVNARDGRLSPQAIQDAAQAAGLNMDTFNKCLDSGEKAKIVSEQMAGGSAAGVTGTPGTIIVTKDGAQELIPGALPYEQVKATVEKYL
jgi:protein-disulfide isomerase